MPRPAVVTHILHDSVIMCRKFTCFKIILSPCARLRAGTSLQRTTSMANLFAKCVPVALLLSVWLRSSGAETITVNDVQRVFPPVDESDSRYVCTLV